MDNETPWVLVIKTEQITSPDGMRIDMYPPMVYIGDFSLDSMYGDGDPDIVNPGEAKVTCLVTKIVADAMRAAVDPVNGPLFQIYQDRAVDEELATPSVAQSVRASKLKPAVWGDQARRRAQVVVFARITNIAKEYRFR